MLNKQNTYWYYLLWVYISAPSSIPYLVVNKSLRFTIPIITHHSDKSAEVYKTCSLQKKKPSFPGCLHLTFPFHHYIVQQTLRTNIAQNRVSRTPSTYPVSRTASVGIRRTNRRPAVMKRRLANLLIISLHSPTAQNQRICAVECIVSYFHSGQCVERR